MLHSQITVDTDIAQRGSLRRYMGLPQLIDLLSSNSLYFRRADGFSDRLEGALFRNLRTSLNEAFCNGEAPHDADFHYRRARLGNYVSCWTIGARDNMALWQLYGGVKTSIAITTTVERLVKCGHAWNRSAHIHKVKYINYRQNQNYVIGRYSDILRYKSSAYRFENELRIVVPQQGDGWEENPMGIRLPLPRIDALITSIVVAPEADNNFLDAVRELCKRYGIKAPVKYSVLALVQP